MKKTMSVFLSLVLVILSVSAAFSSFAAAGSYIDEEGNYHRLSNGNDTCFVTDYDKMIDQFVEAIHNRESTVYNDEYGVGSYNFATKDSAYSYTDADRDKGDDFAAAKKLAQDIESSIGERMKISDVDTLDYFYNRISIDLSINGLVRDNDLQYNYYTFRIFADFSYKNVVSMDEEKYIADVVAKISKNYLATCDDDYEKVKTIYDFIVRNADYDYEVFEGKYSYDSERHSIAHSAYGALCGNILLDGKNDSELNLTAKKSFSGQSIVNTYDQGLAVCEGFSQLFYYLCVYNGIPCHIIQGDHCEKSGKNSDPHQWNLVYLDDGNGARWFIVDTTFAEQESYKLVDLNSYNYFLCGTENVYFGYKNHQQPYVLAQNAVTSERPYSDDFPQRYNWYSLMSPTDYSFHLIDLEDQFSEENNRTIIIRRDTVYNEGESSKATFIETDINSTKIIEYDEEEEGFRRTEDVEGFSYTGKFSKYSIQIPYLLDREYSLVGDTEGVFECGEYCIQFLDIDGTPYYFYFKVVPLDMSNHSNYVVNVDDKEFTGEVNIEYTNFKGGIITPIISVVDRYGNDLVEKEDYDVHVYNRERADGVVNEEVLFDNVGKYYMYIDFKGNYCNSYFAPVTIDKIRLSSFDKGGTIDVAYMPAYYRALNGVTDTNSYFTKSGKDFVIGDNVLTNSGTTGKPIYLGLDYSISAQGGLDYNNEGTVTLTGLDGSALIKPGYPLTYKYKVNGKFDISFLNNNNLGSVATYTGSAIAPISFSGIEKVLTQNKDYRIVSYSNNVNAGYAQVTIEGINGCKGSATLNYYINPASITSAKIDYTTSNGTVNYTLSFGGRVLVKGVDYTEKKVTNSTGYQLIITGIGNFNGSTTFNVSNASNGGSSSGSTANNKTTTTTNAAAKTTVKKPAAPKNFKVKAAKKSFKASWKKVSGVTGYEIQYSTSKKFPKKTTKTVTVKGATKTSNTVKKLKSKKRYYVRVRAYKTVKVKNKKYNVYSPWSTIKSVTVK